jgi:hypothetical protein
MLPTLGAKAPASSASGHHITVQCIIRPHAQVAFTCWGDLYRLPAGGFIPAITSRPRGNRRPTRHVAAEPPGASFPLAGRRPVCTLPLAAGSPGAEPAARCNRRDIPAAESRLRAFTTSADSRTVQPHSDVGRRWSCWTSSHQTMAFAALESTSSMMTACASSPDHSSPKSPPLPGSFNAKKQ